MLKNVLGMCCESLFLLSTSFVIAKMHQIDK